jgi:sulfoxide reductase heme-binding subunit YedZ
MASRKVDGRFLQTLLIVNGAIPALLLGWDAWQGQLGTHPQEFAIRTTGSLTLIFLTLTLTVRPLMEWLRVPALIGLRRTAGLFSFFYALLHLTAYSWFDKELQVRAIVADTLERPFIFLGMAAFLLLLPLAVTSTRAMVRRLGGQRWRRIHWAVYPAACAGVVHYYLLVKADTTYPLGFGLAIGLLLAYRLLRRRLQRHRLIEDPPGQIRSA